MSGETFGQMLRRIRMERGFSQTQLSRLANADPSYVNTLESRTRHRPSRDMVAAIADALDLSYAERDRFLFAAGLAPDTDWQSRCEEAEAALHLVREAVAVLTDAVEPTQLRRATG